MHLLEKLSIFFPGKYIKCSNNRRYCPVYVNLKKNKKMEKWRGREELWVAFQYVFIPKPSISLLEMTKALARVMAVQGEGSKGAQRREKPHICSWFFLSCSGRKNLKTLEYDPCSRDVLPLTGRGEIFSRSSSLVQADSGKPFYLICMLQQHCKLVCKIGLGLGRLNVS